MHSSSAKPNPNTLHKKKHKNISFTSLDVVLGEVVNDGTRFEN